jgi:hypothetical protein
MTQDSVRYNVYVAKPGSVVAKIVAPRSAIVGRMRTGGTLELSFEGGLYAPDWSYRQRLERAIFRLHLAYPTVARCIAERSDVIEVGAWTSGGGKPSLWTNSVLEITDRNALRDWLGEDVFDL